MAEEAHGGGLEFHPMDQFIVKPLFGGEAVHWYTPTNVTLWMFLTVLSVNFLGDRFRAASDVKDAAL